MCVSGRPQVVKYGGQKGTGGEENDSGNVELVGEAESPAQEEVGDDGDWWRRVGSEPVEKRVVEVGEGSHDGEVSGVANVSDVLDAMGEVRVGRERKE